MNWQSLGLPHYMEGLLHSYPSYIHVFGTQLVYEKTNAEFLVLKDCDSPDEVTALLLLLKVLRL